MFCNNCGQLISDDAQFCGHCGKPVVQNSAPQQLRYQTVPYTVPLDAGAVQQYPQYTAPVDAAQQYPQQRVPVNPPAQTNQHRAPVYAPPTSKEPVYTPSETTASGNAVSKKKQLRKKRMTLVAIVAAVVIVLVVLFGYIILSQPIGVWRGILSPRMARSLQRWVLSIYKGLLSLFR